MVYYELLDNGDIDYYKVMLYYEILCNVYLEWGNVKLWNVSLIYS